MAQVLVWKATEATPARIETRFQSLEEWEKARVEGLQQGFFFAATPESLDAYSSVALHLRLPDSRTFETEATVVQVMPGAGMTLQIQPTLLSSFLQTIETSAPPATSDSEELTPSEQELAEEAELPAGERVSREQLQAVEQELTSEEPEEEESEEELNEQDKLSLRERIRKMNVSERMRYAARAGRSGRLILVTDQNPNVMRFLIRNPRIGREEVHRLLLNNRITAEILNIIAKERKWNSSEEIRMLLIRHPRTPSNIAIKMIGTINERNLRTLAKSGNIRDNIKRAALRQLDRLKRARGY